MNGVEVAPTIDGNDDGRNLRRERNRNAVIDALLGLYHEGKLNPSSAEIAERADLSPRSLFRYFDDADDLSASAIDRQLDSVRHLFRIDLEDDASLAHRVAALARRQAALFEAAGPTTHVIRLRAPFNRVVQERLSTNRLRVRTQIAELFSAELGRMSGASATATLAALDVMCSWESYELLRRDQGYSEQEAESVMRRSLTALLAPECPNPDLVNEELANEAANREART